MESSEPQSGRSPDVRPQYVPGCLTESERQALRERAGQARAAAAAALERYVVLLAQSRYRVSMAEQTLVTIDATREMLRESVQRYAHLMKALDTPPEGMLRLVKESLREQVPHPEYDEETKALVEHVITWCIEAYYLDRLPPN